MTDANSQGTLVDRIAARLEALVMEHQLRDGDLLPSERELCDLLGVSRTVVREAVRSLVAKGLLEVRQGRGTIVRAPSRELATEVLTAMLRRGSAARASAADVGEVRRLLAVELAGLAAERRTAQDVRVLEASVTDEAAFAAALGEAAQNPLLAVLHRSVTAIGEQLMGGAAALDGEADRTALLEAIRSGSPDAARAAMADALARADAAAQRTRIADALAGRAPAGDR